MVMIETGRAVMEGYMSALMARGAFAEYLAPDVVIQMPAEGVEVKGREAADAFIRDFHTKAFDAHPEVELLVVEGDHAAAECVFEGTHTGEFAGVPPTGKKVRIPYTAFYDMSAGFITGLRLYGFGALVKELQG